MHVKQKEIWAQKITNKMKSSSTDPLTEDQLNAILDVIESECDYCRSETEWRSMGGSI